MRSLLFLISIMFFQNNGRSVDGNLIKGTWVNVNRGHCSVDDYVDLNFGDSSVVLNVMIDTIFRDEYFVRGDTLILTDNVSYRSRILKLSGDSLVLSSVRDKQFVHTYYRKK